LAKVEELKSPRNKLVDAAQDAVVENLEIDAVTAYAQRLLGK
jgi:hypothetical protein